MFSLIKLCAKYPCILCWRLILKLYLIPRYKIGTFRFKFGIIQYIDIASFVHQYFEIFKEQIYAFKCKKDTPFIVDCGGNIGMTAIWFKQNYPNSLIKIYEPNPVACDALRKNIKECKLNNVYVNQGAAWIRNEIIHMNILHSDQSFVSQLNENTNEVKAFRLADGIDRQVDLLKVDIEGAEFEVLNDLFDTKKIDLINMLICEIHCAPEEGKKIANLLTSLSYAGFITTLIKFRTSKNLFGYNYTTPFEYLNDGKYLGMLYAWRP